MRAPPRAFRNASARRRPRSSARRTVPRQRDQGTRRGAPHGHDPLLVKRFPTQRTRPPSTFPRAGRAARRQRAAAAVEQFEGRQIALPGVDDRRKLGLDLLHSKHARQIAGFLGRAQASGGIVVAHALAHQECVESAQARRAPRHAGRGAVLPVGPEVVAQVVLGGGGRKPRRAAKAARRPRSRPYTNTV